MRQAINMAFDRAALLKDMSDGYGSVTAQVFPTSSPGYQKSLDSYYGFDPAESQAAAGRRRLPARIHPGHAID